MRTADFDYSLPADLVAQDPPADRDQSRLLALNRTTGELEHRAFHDLGDFLHAGDLLVLNDSKVIPARLRAVKTHSGARIEILLLEEIGVNEWWVMLRPGKRARPNTRFAVLTHRSERSGIECEILEKNDEGHARVIFMGAANILAELDALGEMPLPPYVSRPARPADRDRYQTVYAAAPGSVAAPTAGLHFTPSLLSRLKQQGVGIAFVTLHVGLGTFAPVKADRIESHTMHEERFELGTDTADAIRSAKTSGKRIVAVGTTTVRVLEAAAAPSEDRVLPGRGKTRIFIHPPARFKVVDALVTNFHLPKSTLLMLVSAFAAPGEPERGREMILAAYAEAVRERYRFFSYGDAMFIQ